MSLKSVLDNLEAEQRRRLIHAFDNNITQYVELPDSKFVGVHIDIPNFQIIEQVGSWSYGSRILT